MPNLLNCSVYRQKPYKADSEAELPKCFVTEVYFTVRHSVFINRCMYPDASEGNQCNSCISSTGLRSEGFPFKGTTDIRKAFNKEKVGLLENSQSAPIGGYLQDLQGNRTALSSFQPDLIHCDNPHRKECAAPCMSPSIPAEQPGPIGILRTSTENVCRTNSAHMESKADLPKMRPGFSSITIAVRKVATPASAPPETTPYSCLKHIEGTLPLNAVDSVVTVDGPSGERHCKPVLRNRKATIIKVTEYRHRYSYTESGRKARVPEHRHSYAEDDMKSLGKVSDCEKEDIRQQSTPSMIKEHTADSPTRTPWKPNQCVQSETHTDLEDGSQTTLTLRAFNKEKVGLLENSQSAPIGGYLQDLQGNRTALSSFQPDLIHCDNPHRKECAAPCMSPSIPAEQPGTIGILRTSTENVCRTNSAHMESKADLPKMRPGFSSITIAVRKVATPASAPPETTPYSCLKHTEGTLPLNAVSVVTVDGPSGERHCKPVLRNRKATIIKVTEYRHRPPDFQLSKQETDC
ncbi:UNVERIFIED_CONTAM: hypothetical protein FKN15_046765 [Acipenser sinensis]